MRCCGRGRKVGRGLGWKIVFLQRGERERRNGFEEKAIEDWRLERREGLAILFSVVDVCWTWSEDPYDVCDNLVCIAGFVLDNVSSNSARINR